MPDGRRPLVRFLVGLALGTAGVWVVVVTAGGVGDALQAVQRMRVGLVAVAALAAMVRLGLYGLQLLWLGRRSAPLGLRTACGLAFVVFGLGAVTPAAPLEGLALAGRELRRRGQSRRQVVVTFGLSEWFAQRTFYAVASVDLVVVLLLGRLDPREWWPLLIIAALVFAALAGTAALLRRPASAEWVAVRLGALRLRRARSRESRRQAARGWHDQVMTTVGSRGHRALLAGVSTAAVLADATTLWATAHAAGIPIQPDLAVLAATVGTVASWVPLVPSGLGVVEAAIPATLHHFGAPLDDAVAATIVYRGAGTLLPALAGTLAIIALRTRRTPDADTHEARPEVELNTGQEGSAS